MRQRRISVANAQIYRSYRGRPSGVTQYERDPIHGNYKIYHQECFCRVAIATTIEGEVILCGQDKNYDRKENLMAHVKTQHRHEWDAIRAAATMTGAGNIPRARRLDAEACYGAQLILINEAAQREAEEDDYESDVTEDDSDAADDSDATDDSDAADDNTDAADQVTDDDVEAPSSDNQSDMSELMDVDEVPPAGSTSTTADASPELKPLGMVLSRAALERAVRQIGRKVAGSMTSSRDEGLDSNDESLSTALGTKASMSPIASDQQNEEDIAAGKAVAKGKGRGRGQRGRARARAQSSSRGQAGGRGRGKGQASTQMTPYEVQPPVLKNGVEDHTPPREYLAKIPFHDYRSPYLTVYDRFDRARHSLQDIDWESAKDETDAQPFRRFKDTQLHRIEKKIEDVKTQIAELNIIYDKNNISTYENGSFYRCRAAVKKLEHLVLKVVGPRVYTHDEIQEMRNYLLESIEQVYALQQKLGLADD